MQTVTDRRVAAEERGQGLRHRVIAVRVDRLSLVGCVVLETILRRRAGVDERVEAYPAAGLHEIDGGDEVRANHLVDISLRRIRAVGSQVEYPVRPDMLDECAGVAQIDLVPVDVVLEIRHTPRGSSVADEDVDLVILAEQTSDQIGADKSRGAGNDRALHG
jgi:hypothetical protein